VPLIATARIVEPTDADALIDQGVADAVGMNRALITDPDMPNKAKDGREDEIIRCIACNACIAHYHAETPLRCAQNPRTGRELTMARPQANGVRKRIVVVGGGPAGLAAAAEAGARGQEVVLLERGELGGQVGLAGRSPTHREMADTLMANYAQLLKAGHVEIELGKHVDGDLLETYEPDCVIVATGARPFLPKRAFPGVEVVQVWDLLAGARPDGEILIADWGGDPAALDCAELLAAEERSVTLVVGAVSPGETLHQYSRNVYIGRLLRAGVRIENWLGLDRSGSGKATFRNIFAPDLETSFACDVLALSLGRVPNQELEIELDERGIVFHSAGDCCSPRTIEEAILEGTRAAIAVSDPRPVGQRV
jgi:NADPH-dependent 2,4-dienoyl-CoA reductase/sulfur reductase-like enzyme